MIHRMGHILCSETPSAGVREEHIDVIISEEALLDRKFGAWLAQKLNLGDARVIDAVSSFWSGSPSSESDIVILFEGRDLKQTLVHIENKITTRLSDEQVDGYERRIKEHAALLGIDSYITAIVAPHRYLDWQLRSTRFDHRISYEDIADQIDGQSHRQRLRAQTLRSGIERFERLGIPKHTADWVSRRHQNLRIFRFTTRHPAMTNPEAALMLEEHSKKPNDPIG